MTENSTIVSAQLDRTERARSAIQAGRFRVRRIAPSQWSVQNGEKHPYAVSLYGEQWSCTCMDYQQRGPEVRCKHIEGVRLLEDALVSKTQVNPPEIRMDQTQRLNQASDILWQLRQPLELSRVKRRQAPGTGSVPYLEGYDVIDQANSLFDFAWSFDLTGQPIILRWQKKVMVWNQLEKRKVPLVDSNGQWQTEEVGLVYIIGKVTVQLAGKDYSHSDLGRCIFSGDTPEALDMAIAGSATDCLKRFFRQLGEQFGNSLYDKDIAQTAGLQSGATHHQTTPRTTSSAAPVVRSYTDGNRVNGNPSEQEAFDAYLQTMQKAPASKDELRNWLAAQRTQPQPASIAG